MRIDKCCNQCGSTDVRLDAWASWNPDAQQWELENVFDNAWCEDCQANTTLTEDPLP